METPGMNQQNPTEHLATDQNPFHFTDSGLDNVYLVGIKYFTHPRRPHRRRNPGPQAAHAPHRARPRPFQVRPHRRPRCVSCASGWASRRPSIASTSASNPRRSPASRTASRPSPAPPRNSAAPLLRHPLRRAWPLRSRQNHPPVHARRPQARQGKTRPRNPRRQRMARSRLSRLPYSSHPQ